MSQYKIGYTQGVYDMFHIGHLNLLNAAKKYCDYLIVGVNSDELVQNYKGKVPIINQQERKIIIENIKAVDEAVIVDTLDKEQVLEKIKFDAIFIGDDWKGHPRWEETRIKMGEKGVNVVFLPHTPNISSTFLRDKEDAAIKE